MERSYHDLIFCRVEEGIARVQIRNAPLNVLTIQGLKALGDCFEALKNEKGLRCVVLIGAGRAFAAGGDLAEFQAFDENEFLNHIAFVHRVYTSVEVFPVPVIAAINGYALGGGLELALCCDIRIAAKEASMALPEATFGMMPSYGGTARMAKIVGPGTAKHLIFTGKRITAQRAYELGLVQEIYPGEELEEKALEMAKQIASKAPLALREVKAAIYKAQGESMEEAMKLEFEGVKRTSFSTERIEGVDAFLEKREPQFEDC